MATYDQAGPGSVAQPPRTLANTANWAGALVSLALVAGVGVWGYKLLVRDVSGVPVIQASEGPMRIAPEDPGGESADHQGLSVNDVAGTGLAADFADTLTLAPQPTGLADEDVALSEIQPLDPIRPRQNLNSDTVTEATLSAETESEAVAPRAEPLAKPVSDDPIQALADEIAAGIEPLFPSPTPESASEAVAALTDAVTPDEDGEAEIAELDSASEPELTKEQAAITGGVARSLRPKNRPSALRTVALAPANITPMATPELDPGSLPDGTRLVQLGAFESPEVARAEWDRLDGRFSDYLEGKSRVIERATSGGRIFYRLRAHGFSDISDARRFCAAFVAENADCIPVVSR
jgi:hypothetical protein